MGVKLLLFTICKFCGRVFEMGVESTQKLNRLIFHTHFVNIEVSANISIYLS